MKGLINVNKISINLTSGRKEEKPLISAFRGSAGQYVVLDNEANGTMGLPIILVSKFDGTKLSKIEDQNEWGAVKEMLRNIIAGNQMDYISIPESLLGDDIFYSQLTLPIASFESLKANYNPVTMANTGVASPDASVNQNVAPAVPVDSVVNQNAGIPNVMPSIDPNMMNQSIPTSMPNIEAAPSAPAPAASEIPASPAPAPMPDASVMPSQEVVQGQVSPAVAASMPAPAPDPVMPVSPNVNMEASSNVAPSMAPEVSTPNVAPVMPSASNMSESAVVEPVNNSQVDFTADKAAFLQACENMFDALVAKFNK